MPDFILQRDGLGNDGAGQCKAVSEQSLLWVVEVG